MKYKLLGNSGLRVSELCLGAMTFGEEFGWGASKQESKKIFDAFANAGGNFIDTANKYTLGTSERYCGEFIYQEREHFILATKYTLTMKEDDPNFCGNHRKNMIQSVEASLKRLNTEYIDLLWLHAWDYMTPQEEIMRALDDLVRMGKVFYIGISDTPAWIVSRANMLAELRGWTPFVGLQIKYSLLERTVERELLPMARALDLAVTPWGVIGGGVLTGKYKKSGNKIEAEDSERVKTRETIPDRDLEIAAKVQGIAKKRGVSAAQVAINWARQQKGVIIPIIGARKEEQIKDNLKCLDFELNPDELDALDEVSKIDLGFPHEFLHSESIIKVLFGETFEQTENHRSFL
jgi:aryl-alcohol dehydrogenase-like predicted oxidoreductase